MEKVNFNKSMKETYASYERATARTLWDVYDSFSHAKQQAFDYCQKLQYEHHGENGRIIGANGFKFSYGFTYTDENNKKHFVYITKSHDKDAVID